MFFKSEQQQVVSVTTGVEWGGGGYAQCVRLLVTRDHVVLHCITEIFVS